MRHTNAKTGRQREAKTCTLEKRRGCTNRTVVVDTGMACAVIGVVPGVLGNEATLTPLDEREKAFIC